MSSAALERAKARVVRHGAGGSAPQGSPLRAERPGTCPRVVVSPGLEAQGLELEHRGARLHGDGGHSGGFRDWVRGVPGDLGLRDGCRGVQRFPCFRAWSVLPGRAIGAAGLVGNGGCSPQASAAPPAAVGAGAAATVLHPTTCKPEVRWNAPPTRYPRAGRTKQASIALSVRPGRCSRPEASPKRLCAAPAAHQRSRSPLGAGGLGG